MLYLPKRLDEARRGSSCWRSATVTYGIGDLFGATQIRFLEALRARSALDPRDLIRSADKMLHELSQKIGPIPGTDLPFFPTNPTRRTELRGAPRLRPAAPGQASAPGSAALLRRVIDLGARTLPA